MDNQRLLIWASFGLLLWMTYQAWMEDYGPQPAAQPSVTQPAVDTPIAEQGAPALPADSADAPAISDEAPALPGAPAPAPTPEVSAVENTISVQTDVLDIQISPRGGSLVKAALLEYPVEKNRPEDLVHLLDPGQARFGAIQTGLNAFGDGPKPDHTAMFESASSEYELGNADEIVVPLTWSDGQGITVEKTFTFRRGSYQVDVDQRIVNEGGSDWRGADYAQILRYSRELERSMFDVESYSFSGPLIYDGSEYEKIDRDDLIDDGPLSVQTTEGWVGFIQRHFVTAAVPPGDKEYVYNLSVQNNIARTSLISTPALIVSPGNEHTFEFTLFVGPKLQEQLEQVTDSLKLAVDYGWLTIISQPLFLLLDFVYSFVANWGVAIILVTILIKLAFYKLTEKSGRSMAKMREIQPRMQAIQERYKDDRQAQGQAMMELYKREQVNPAAGCMPILIQMPFFLAFYWVLLESVEMRQAHFALWLTDLSVRDPYFILPILMGAAMLFQQKLNPTPADPVQARVMQIMPIMFTAFFAFFPAGLVLYWVTNTILSVAQQWYINKVVHEEALAKKGGGKKKDKTKKS